MIVKWLFDIVRNRAIQSTNQPNNSTIDARPTQVLHFVIEYTVNFIEVVVPFSRVERETM